MNGLIEIVPLVVLALAAYRATRFFVFDSFMGFNLASESAMSDRLDRWAYWQDGETFPNGEKVPVAAVGTDRNFIRGKIGDLLTCPYCLGFWISLITYLTYCAVTEFPPTFWMFGINVFAVSGAQALLNGALDN